MSLTDTDVLIIGAGPAALFAAYELGLFGLHCHLIDSLDRAGGQCGEFYADKPIHDLPGSPAILAGDLVERMLQQLPAGARFTFGRTATGILPLQGGGFEISTDGAEKFAASAVIVATGWRTARNGPVANWGLELGDRGIPVDTRTFETATRGIFVIGDAACYPGKLKLLVSAFHEAALAVQGIRKRLRA